MADGYMGKILKVDLTDETFEEIPTDDYRDWVGGHGMGSAIFWDLCEDYSVKGDDPKNVVTIMTSPMSGTIAPSVAGRTEVQAIGMQGFPQPWYTRSNFGGRFSAHVKYAGWDGIVLTGKASRKVWLNIIDGHVSLESADDLWGLNTREAQEEIWAIVATDFADEYGAGWKSLDGSRDKGRTTQKPAVLATGANAERYGPLASLIHDAGNGAGQGGFGGVFAAKNLKAVSVLGTGGVEIHDPQGIFESRLWAYDYTHAGHAVGDMPYVGSASMGALPGSTLGYMPSDENARPQGCLACIRNCRARTESGLGNESSCVEFMWYSSLDRERHGEVTDAAYTAATAIQENGINAWEVASAVYWLRDLYELGVIGPGKEIDSNLPYDKIGEKEFAIAMVDAIINQTDIGPDLSLGTAACADKWGRYEEDTTTGILAVREWGYGLHYDTRFEAEWGYGSMVADRDCNNHDFNFHLFWTPTISNMTGIPPTVPADQMVKIISDKLVPYSDPMMLDYSDEGIYSEAMAKTVAWHRHYARFWKDSVLYCDWAWADFVNPFREDHVGLTGEGEPRFFKDVTGTEITFEEGMELGRKIWNLDRAIWVMQGRHRDMETLTEYHYTVPAPLKGDIAITNCSVVYENGKWQYKDLTGRLMDRQKVEEWKTKFYALEGWDTANGWPSRKTLEGLDLGYVADKLEQERRLGADA